MPHTGEAAEQLVNMATGMTVKGVEFATNMVGKGALSLATFLLAALKDQKRTKGKARMQAFNGKPTKVFVIRREDFKQFAEEAKKYGVLYAAVVSKKDRNGVVDVVVNANDAAKVNRIAERFAMPAEEVEQLRSSILKAREEKAQKAAAEPTEKNGKFTVEDQTINEMLGEKQRDPETAQTEKSSPSAHTSGNKERSEEVFSEPEHTRSSVRAQIKEMKAVRKEKQEQKSAPDRSNRQTVHKQPKKKRKKKER